MKKEEQSSIRINGLDPDKINKHPNILIAASFWEEDRYHAAKVCYQFMRKIDDMVDEHKAAHKTFADCEKHAFTDQINNWIDCIYQKASQDVLIKEVIEIVDEYQIPIQLFHRFSQSMLYDINHDSFQSFEDFLNYAEGASVAPAAIFVHLCCLNEAKNSYLVPKMDLLTVTRPCAIFSYIVHIIRDFKKDFDDNLVYFASKSLEENRLSLQDLFNVAHGIEIPIGFRNLIKQYVKEAEFYKQQTEKTILEISPYLSERYLLSLKVIFQLYLSIFNQIDTDNGNFTTDELTPSPTEIVSIVSSLTNQSYFV